MQLACLSNQNHYFVEIESSVRILIPSTLPIEKNWMCCFCWNSFLDSTGSLLSCKSRCLTFTLLCLWKPVSVRCEILQHSANLILRPMCAASLCLQEIKCLQPKVNVFTKRLHVGVKSKHFGSNREWWQIYDMLEGNCWNFVQYINGVSQFKSVIFIHEIETVAWKSSYVPIQFIFPALMTIPGHQRHQTYIT